MNWNILVILGKKINRDIVSSGERKQYSPLKVFIKEIVGKLYINCESQIRYE